MRYVLVALLASLGAGLAPADPPPDLVTAFETEFAKDGLTYRFIGVNIRGLVHYGGGDGALPWTTLAHIDENLAGAAGMGCRVVRVFAANRNISHEEAADRLGYALDKAQQYDLKLIIALTDFYPTPFHPQGDDGYYTENPWGWTVLNHAWFAGGYQENYLPYVTLAVSTHKDHPAIFSWQLGNEIADQIDADTHDAFVHAVAAHIKSLDPYHMVSIGMLSLAHIPGYTTSRGIALYSDPNLDFLTAHRYNDDLHPIDFAVRNGVQKPIVMSETGCAADHPAVGGDRVGFMDGRVNLFVYTNGARGLMNWGYQAQAYDIGDGDSIFGIDRYAHPDYDGMVAMYAGHAAILNAYQQPVGPATGPRGRNLALDAVAWETDSDFGPDYAGDKAIDAALDTKWTSTASETVHRLALDLGAEWILTGFRPQLAGAAGKWTCFNLRHYLLQTGPGLSGPWTTAFDVHNESQLDSITSTFTTPLPARYVRIYIDDCGIDDYARLPEFEVIGDPNPRADLDGDEDVDLADMALFQGCFGGAGSPPPPDFASCDCDTANLHTEPGDPPEGDVDLLDVEEAATCLHGPGVAVPLACY